MERSQEDLMRGTWLDELWRPMAELVELTESAGTVGRRLSEIFEPVDRNIRQIRALGEAVNASLIQMQRDVQVAAIKAGEIGWFLPMYYPIGGFSILARGQSDQIASLMEAHWRANYPAELELTYSILNSSNPARLAIVKDAVLAHEQHRFFLSIPVFLAQADGLYFQRSGGDLFSAKQELRVPTRITDTEFLNFYAQIFRSHTPISAKRKDPEHDFFPERHRVMHGRSTTYGTEINSLKALSLLCLCAVAELNDDAPPES